MPFYYGEANEAGVQVSPRRSFVRVDLTNDFFDRVFSARCKLIELRRQFPSLSELVFYSNVMFGDFGDELPVGDQRKLLDDGFLVSLTTRLDAKFSPVDSTDSSGEQFETVTPHGIELRLTGREEAPDLFFVAIWWEFLAIYARRACQFKVTENVASIARGIIVDGAFDRLPVLAEALDDTEASAGSSPPSWLGFALRETDPFETGRFSRHLVFAPRDPLSLEPEPPTSDPAKFSSFFVSLCLPTPSA